MTITHSCCPGKTNIYAPAFKVTETFHTSRGDVKTYECTKCSVVIIVEGENETILQG